MTLFLNTSLKERRVACDTIARMGYFSTEAYKGVRDFYPEDMAFLKYFFETCRTAVEKMGYVEYGASILEPAELYRAKGAENEELAREQTYTFTDRGGREVTLRPEMTPTVARMVAARRRELGFPLRLYSLPNLFRYERPQQGRLREHWQLNVDLFGSRSPAADMEILSAAYEIMRAFGATEEDFVIRVNDRRSVEAFMETHGLSAEEQSAFLRLLDGKRKMSDEAFETGLSELGIPPAALPSSAPAELAQMLAEFEAAGMRNIVYAPDIVRGFAYYTGMVFEVYDTHEQNPRALFGGGRYDNLTALFDSEPVPGVGFGMGDVRLRDFLALRNLLPPFETPTKLYIALADAGLALEAEEIARMLRAAGTHVAVDFGERKIGDQIKAAAKNGIPFLFVLGENELASQTCALRNVRTGHERTVAFGDIPAAIKAP